MAELVEAKIHPAFVAFSKICAELDFATIEKLEIQNGLPVFVETTEGIVLPGAKITKKRKLV